MLLVALGVSWLAAAPPAASEPGVLQPAVTAPLPGSTVGVGSLTVRGTVSQPRGDEVAVVYVVDVSGSTVGQKGFDCNGDETVDAQDDFNGADSVGTVLDCQIAGIMSLTRQLSRMTRTDVKVGVVPFGVRAQVADMSPVAGETDFTTPSADDDGSAVPDVEEVARSLRTGRTSLFERRSVGYSTDYDAALNAALDSLETTDGSKYVFMLSDGFPTTFSTSTLDRVGESGAAVRTFAVTSGSDGCREGGPLHSIASTTASECTYVEDPSQLSTAILKSPADVVRVDVRLDGGDPITAQVDPFGGFTAEVDIATPGMHTVMATVHGADGSTATSLVSFHAIGEGSGDLVQDISVGLPSGALVFTQRCGVFNDLPAEPGVAGFPGYPDDLPARAGTADQVGTAPDIDLTTESVEPDPLFDQYPERGTNPSRCGIDLGQAAPVMDGPIGGQYFSAHGALAEVTVLDMRPTDPGWTVTGSVSDFVSAADGFSGNHLGWTPVVVEDSVPTPSGYDQVVTAGPLVLPGTGVDTGRGLADGAVLGSAQAGSGNGAAVLSARLRLLSPTTAPAGEYRASLTLTVL